jgi:hypothetical protein
LTPLFVEFVGLPGGGKTTASSGAARILEQRGYACAHRPPLPVESAPRARRWVSLLWFRLRHWRLIVAGVVYLMSIRPFRWSRLRTIRHVLFLAYYHHVQVSGSHQIVLLDQSIVQTMWAAAVPDGDVSEKPLVRLLRAFHAAAPCPLALVAVKVDPDVAAHRTYVRRRPKPGVFGRTERLSEDQLRSLFVRGGGTLEGITRHAIRVTGAPALEVDGSATHRGSTPQVRVADFAESVLEELCTVSSAPEDHDAPADVRSRRSPSLSG